MCWSTLIKSCYRLIAVFGRTSSMTHTLNFSLLTLLHFVLLFMLHMGGEDGASSDILSQQKWPRTRVRTFSTLFYFSLLTTLHLYSVLLTNTFFSHLCISGLSITLSPNIWGLRYILWTPIHIHFYALLYILLFSNAYCKTLCKSTGLVFCHLHVSCDTDSKSLQPPGLQYLVLCTLQVILLYMMRVYDNKTWQACHL